MLSRPDGGGLDASTAELRNPSDDLLNEDIFGSSQDGDPYPIHVGTQTHQEPSDVPRLRATQNTAGYREGLTAAKASVAQNGFDEGYPLGAAIGNKAGVLLGILEGVVDAIKARNTSMAAISSHVDKTEVSRIENLLEKATSELGMQSIFGPEYWESHGNWKFDVPGSEENIVFDDVARSHPMIQKWETLIRPEETRLRIGRDLLKGRSRLEQMPEGYSQEKEKAPNKESRDPLQW